MSYSVLQILDLTDISVRSEFIISPDLYYDSGDEYFPPTSKRVLVFTCPILSSIIQ